MPKPNLRAMVGDFQPDAKAECGFEPCDGREDVGVWDYRNYGTGWSGSIVQADRGLF